MQGGVTGQGEGKALRDLGEAEKLQRPLRFTGQGGVTEQGGVTGMELAQLFSEEQKAEPVDEMGMDLWRLFREDPKAGVPFVTRTEPIQVKGDLSSKSVDCGEYDSEDECNKAGDGQSCRYVIGKSFNECLPIDHEYSTARAATAVPTEEPVTATQIPTAADTSAVFEEK